ncbi:hypothetical protein GOP47_0024847 [Adiantum capillus-veneris]|uniref:Peroxidase n=1 Tax=Adiantum capillus-veneris TaxID=13818 RepID=A0A9D4Z4P9_ADICA|nr:hypothetical protein GOP47_0024847 [Adiantum capillus-veneris]
MVHNAPSISPCEHSSGQYMKAVTNLPSPNSKLSYHSLLVGLAHGQGSLLSSGFYGTSCPSVKRVVANAVAARLREDPSIAGPLLRMFFHDCFVFGCDASVLIKSTPSNSAERDAGPNQTIRELGLIDTIKVQLEAVCPGVVSCADIVALAAKEAVVQSGGPDWEVEVGRRDGSNSTAAEASTNLPSSLLNVPSLIQFFASKGLSIRDLVTLSGAHSIGNAHCFQAARRIYGFKSPSGIDPTMNISYAQVLKKTCPLPIVERSRVPLDPSTPALFDNKYYQDLLQNRGLFTSDSSLVADSRTSSIVVEYAKDEQSFFTNFVRSMLNMGRIGVLTGGKGEIRRHCSSINH